METNSEIELARRFVEQTDMNVLLLGRAGTGKTTFLRGVVESRVKRTVVLAPTGVAAINAGGNTLHSFFQLPLAPYIPGTTFRGHGNSQGRVRREKLKIIRSLDLLIIDEISMVRADVLDAVDAALRLYRQSGRPFGGVQLLMIGDLAQLAPVVKDDERELLARYYESPYFFASRALAAAPHVSISLTHVYRQRDPEFVALLEHVRSGRLDGDALRLLNGRYKPDFCPKDDEGYIRLTTHNRQADAYNESRLEALRSPMFTYDAAIEGDFPEQLFPVERQLRLKVGAQVMFCKNDLSPAHRYYNGKVGRISRLDAKSIAVSCDDGGSDIEVKRDIWTNSRYALDAKSKEIVEDVQGTFAQYPLRHAWAITIHKCQGLTFDRCVVDAAQAFASGQVYVALSRCRTLEGLVLNSPIPAWAIKTDPSVERFVATEQQAASRAEASLPQLQLAYKARLIDELFDFSGFVAELHRLADIIENSLYKLYPQLVGRMRDAERALGGELKEVALRFRQQYVALLSAGDEARLCERVRKACAYYHTRFHDIVASIIGLTKVDSDSEAVSLRIEESRTALIGQLYVKMRLLKFFAGNDFSVSAFLHNKAMALVEDPSVLTEKHKKESNRKTRESRSARPSGKDGAAMRPNGRPTARKKAHGGGTSDDDIANPALFAQLRQWRKETAEARQVPIYLVANQRTLADISATLPTSEAELLAISGITKQKIRLYGRDILLIVRAYADASDEV